MMGRRSSHWSGGLTTSMLCIFMSVRFVSASTSCRSANIFSNPPWRHADQQHAGLRPDVLEGMRGSAGDEDDGPGGRAHNAVAEFEVKLPTHDVEELVLGSVDVGGRPALGRNGLAKQAERSSGLLACCQQFGDIRRSALRPRETGRTVG